MKCAVLNCDNNTSSKSKELSFFSFPKNEKASKQWEVFCGNTQKINTRTALICSEHFKADDIVGGLAFEIGMSSKRRLWPGAMPCMHKTPETEATIGRRKRRDQHSNKRLMVELLSESNDAINPLEENVSEAEIEQEDEHYEEHQSQSSSTNTCHTKTADRRIDDDILDVESSEAVIDELTNLNETLRMENMRHKVNMQLMQKKYKSDAKEYAHKLERAKFQNKQLEMQLATFFTPQQIAQMRNNIDKLWIKKCRYVTKTIDNK